MEDKNPQGLILLTYKGKILLMYKRNGPGDEEQHLWSFIGGVREKKESFENALVRKVEKEVGIRIENVEFVSEACYYARLTDDNVNKMERAENQLLDFFSLKELDNLFLSKTTRQFISKHATFII